jgi:large subunit ribosomal protein L17
MRHNKKFNHLGRQSAHRKAMLANMTCSLILHKRITTTVAKAKALKIYAEPLITKSKSDTTHNRRTVFSKLKSKTAVTELFREVSPRIAERPGGYLRILKTGLRLGDSADMCIIELVDFNEAMLGATEDKKAAASRRRRGGAKKAAEAPAVVKTKTSAKAKAQAAEAEVVEEVAETPEVQDEAPVIEETPAVEETPQKTEEKKEE